MIFHDSCVHYSWDSIRKNRFCEVDKKVFTKSMIKVNILFYSYLSKKSGAQEMGSTPYQGTIQDLTFNLFSILSDQHLSANAPFWITVWITALGRDPGTEFRSSSFAATASWTPNRGYLGWLLDMDRIEWRGGGICSGCLRLGPRTGDGWVESVKRNFVWIS